MKEFERVCGLNDLPELTKEIINELGESGIVLLKGDLAAGKTTFVKEFVRSLGLHVEVSSPTFSVLNEYGNSVNHYDIYQKGFDGFLQNGLLETLDEPKYHLIEWADVGMESLLKQLEMDYINIEIYSHKNTRNYKVTIHAHA